MRLVCVEMESILIRISTAITRWKGKGLWWHTEVSWLLGEKGSRNARSVGYTASGVGKREQNHANEEQYYVPERNSRGALRRRRLRVIQKTCVTVKARS
jgi:hypothetical protein